MTEAAERGVPLAVVAAAAGVSIPTVSKVLNSRPDVSDATRRRVMATLAEHGYTVRPPRTKPTGLIDIRVVSLDSPWSEAVVRGAAATAQRLGFDLVITVDPDPDDCASWVRHTLERGTDGLVSVVTVPDEPARAALARLQVPVVVVDPRTRPAPDLLSVGATNWQGGVDATAHLVGLGHRRIATITGPLEQANALARLAGYRTALIQAGIGSDDDLVRSGNFGIEAGYAGATYLLGLDDPPTAIVAGSDDTALGALRAVREAGLRVPQDLSLVGFDDHPVAAWLDPPLTTVRQPLVEMGATAVELVHRARTGSGHTLRPELATELVVRASTAPPPGR
ncbi:LacI family DNA-binding transcriptional regulator [Cellulomonas hominis]